MTKQKISFPGWNSLSTEQQSIIKKMLTVLITVTEINDDLLFTPTSNTQLPEKTSPVASRERMNFLRMRELRNEDNLRELINEDNLSKEFELVSPEDAPTNAARIEDFLAPTDCVSSCRNICRQQHRPGTPEYKECLKNCVDGCRQLVAPH